MWSDIPFISLALGPEETWTKAAHVWVFAVKSVVMRGYGFVFKNLSLMIFPADTVKSSHAYTNMEFM